MLALRRRWQTVEVRWARGGADEIVFLACPSGHERSLRRGGAWLSIHHQDVVRAGADEAEYLAPAVPRHCGGVWPAGQEQPDLADPFLIYPR